MEQNIEILVVEDSKTQARWLGMLLKQQGYRTSVAYDGQEAMEMLADSVPALVITDIMMPEVDGFELCRRIKSDERLGGIPVILLTALSDPSDVLHAIKCGADNFITKPYDPDFLLSRVEQTLKNRELMRGQKNDTGVERVLFGGQEHEVPSRRTHVVPLLLSTYEEAVLKNVELKESLDTIRALEADYREILKCNTDGIVVCDMEGLVQFVNPAGASLLGRLAEDLLDKPFEFGVDEEPTKEVDILQRSGKAIVAEIKVVDTHWDRQPARLASIRDVTEQARQRRELRTMAFDDELTGLHNRRGFVTLAEQQLAEARRRGLKVVLYFIDMDGLKWINDNLGHQEGDRAIADMAVVLTTAFRQTDIIARLGGDEFAVVASDVPSDAKENLVRRLQRYVDQHNDAEDRPYVLAASVGTVVWNPSSTEDLEQLLTRADGEMYEQKKRKKRERGEAPTR
jgi:two-component system, cell cycle response regulator